MLGNLLVLGAMASWIIYTFISKGLGERYSSLKLTTMQTLFSIPLFVPFTISEVPAWRVPSMTAFLHLLFLGVFCSALAYVFFLYSIHTLGPVLPSAALNLIPVVTIITGRIVLSEQLTWIQALGAVLIMGGLTLLSLMNLKERAQKKNGSQGQT
ncbi:MAG: DMT family transporter [Clostridiaceae bacterium]|nr:DMT family transporter [Clostridiaceae bacterium]